MRLTPGMKVQKKNRTTFSHGEFTATIERYHNDTPGSVWLKETETHIKIDSIMAVESPLNNVIAELEKKVEYHNEESAKHARKSKEMAQAIDILNNARVELGL